MTHSKLLVTSFICILPTFTYCLYGLQLAPCQVAHQAEAYPGFSSMKRLGVFLLPSLDGMLVHRRVTPSIKFAGTHLHSWVERGTVRVKCLAQEHKTMSTARAQTRTARAGVELTNHETTTPPTAVKETFRIVRNMPMI